MGIKPPTNKTDTFSSTAKDSIITYITLEKALAIFHQPFNELSETQQQKIKRLAREKYALELLVLTNYTPTKLIQISPKTLQEAYQEIAGRYAEETLFLADLHRNNLNQNSLHEALRHVLHMKALFHDLALTAPSVSTAEIESFWEKHHAEFDLPEARSTYHILLTINPDFKENTRSVVWTRINQIRKDLVTHHATFQDLALKNSECPTAIRGGKLGRIERGKLFPILDEYLFTMLPGEISPALESPLGFHLLKCDKIHKARTISKMEAFPKIKAKLTEQAQKQHISKWINELLVTSSPS